MSGYNNRFGVLKTQDSQGKPCENAIYLAIYWNTVG